MFALQATAKITQNGLKIAVLRYSNAKFWWTSGKKSKGKDILHCAGNKIEKCTMF